MTGAALEPTLGSQKAVAGLAEFTEVSSDILIVRSNKIAGRVEMSDISGPILWSDTLEDYFRATAERAHGLSWIHKRSEARYSGLRNYIDLPVIILGVLNGATSVGSGSLFDDPKMASIAVGIVAIIGAILSTISSYFKWAARAEAHRIASIQYGKLNRWLAVQLGLPRAERLTAAEVWKYCKQEYDRLVEISPIVPPEVIAEFQSKFNKPQYKNISRPIETNGLEAVIVNRGEESGIELVLSPTPVDDK
jgi:hypothetical protein